MHAGYTPASSYRQGARTFTSIRCKAADLTLIIDRLKGPHTQIFGPRAAADKIHVIRSSPTAKPKGEQWTIEAVPAYNLQRGPSVGRLSHDKGCGNGCILNYGRRITAGELRQANYGRRITTGVFTFPATRQPFRKCMPSALSAWRLSP
jgi:hypothetical protein